MSALTDLFTNIAVAIRSKTGGAGTIVASNFPSAISNIVTLAGGSADATATEANVLAGSTFYAQGVKKTGTLPEMPHTLGTVYPTDIYGNFGTVTPTRGIYPAGTIVYANAAAAGITPEKILQGQSILGVAGTGISANTIVDLNSTSYTASSTADTNPGFDLLGSHIKRLKITGFVSTNYTPQPFIFVETGTSTYPEFFLYKGQTKVIQVSQAGTIYTATIKYNDATNRFEASTNVTMGGYGGWNGVRFAVTQQAFCIQ